MGKYLVLWEIDQTKLPIEVQERALVWGLLMGLFGQGIEEGLTKDWGTFVGETNGYAISEGTELELMLGLAQYETFCIFKVHPIATNGHVLEMIKSLSG